MQGGADYQFAPNWVIGAEAQYSWLTGNNGGAPRSRCGTTVTGNTNQLGSVTGRIGYTWGPALLYAKGGYAWRDSVDVGASVGGVPVAFTVDGRHRDGYTVGGGLEYMFAPNWSAKGEYMYYNFGNTTFTGGPAEIIGARFREDEHTFKLGVNYRFGWGGAGGGALLTPISILTEKAGFEPAFFIAVEHRGLRASASPKSGANRSRAPCPSGTGSPSAMIRAGTSSGERDIADHVARTQKR